MSLEKIVADTHEMLQEVRKAKGLPPWDFSTPPPLQQRQRGARRIEKWVKVRMRQALTMAKAAGVGK